MNALTVISTDLLTPLGAYLRLREGAQASFLLESVEHGRLGRHSFVGCGSRLVDFREAEESGLPVVGYLSYDHAAALEPTVPLPDAGRNLPESRFVVAEKLVRFDHALGMADVLAGEPGEVSDLLRGPQPPIEADAGRRGSTRRLPSRHDYERAVVAAKEHIRAGDAFQIVLSQRAERPTPASAIELYRSLRRVNPSPYLFLLELDGLALVGSSPETLVKAEGRAASLNPIAGTTRPGEGDAERLLDSEKDRAEHVMLVDLGRNDLSRVCRPGSVHVGRFLEPERFSHVTHLVSEVVGELQDGRLPLRPAARVLPGRDRVGRTEGARDAADLRARGLPARAVRGRGALRAPRRGARRVHRDPDDRAHRGHRAPAGGRRDRRRLRPRRRARRVPAQAGSLGDGDRPRGGSWMILLIDNYDSFTYNLAHLFGELGAEVVVRRNDAIDADEAERLAPSQLVVSPGPGRPADAGASVEIVRRLSGSVPTLGVCLGHQAIVEAFGGEVGQAKRLVHGKASEIKHDGRGLFEGLPEPFEAGRYHSLAVTSVPDCLEVSATCADDEVMAVRHRELRVDGVQFHPESVLTPVGPQLARNFLEGSR